MKPEMENVYSNASVHHMAIIYLNDLYEQNSICLIIYICELDKCE